MGTENIVVPAELYVGYSKRAGTEAEYLGFATYKEDNAAFRKRQGTVIGWSNAKDKNPDTFDNKPRAGYRMSKNVTHGGGWNDITTWWRVVDPRGFEIEISSGNVAKLFQYTDILKGEVQGECVFGWDKGNGSKIVLLPVNSEIYVDSQKSTERHYAKSLALKDIKLGDWVELKNGIKGTFFGKFNYTYTSLEPDTYAEIKFDSSYIIFTDVGHLYFVAGPKIINAKDGEKIYTSDEAEEFLNEKARNNTIVMVAGNSNNPHELLFFTNKEQTSVDMKFSMHSFTFDELRGELAVKNPHGAGFDLYKGLHLKHYFDPIILMHTDGTMSKLNSFPNAADRLNHWYGKRADFDKYQRSYSHKWPESFPYPEWLDGKGLIPKMHIVKILRSKSVSEPLECGLPFALEMNPHYRSNRYWYGQEDYEMINVLLDTSTIAQAAFLRVKYNGQEYKFKR